MADGCNLRCRHGEALSCRMTAYINLSRHVVAGNWLLVGPLSLNLVRPSRSNEGGRQHFAFFRNNVAHCSNRIRLHKILGYAECLPSLHSGDVFVAWT